ncbi:Hypothetical protein F387_02053 [Wohlfahrtiimonas chitiniclastica SH04]|uniref:Uncharacterized protein n=1 Tax=Wohlfahrtiimonas chitiniclastica SH04 TaxID=1261130 RepID=L8XWH1_9GAMM|nr:Hypothetical protein F387_02053 [Wohlfahrtiimonas chitiniclastica SH04]
MTFKDEFFSENKKYFSDNKQVSIVRKSDVAWLLRDINIWFCRIKKFKTSFSTGIIH